MPFRSLVTLFSLLAASGCSSGGGAVAPGPAAPAGVSAVTAGGALRIDGAPNPEALSYRIYYDTQPGVDVQSDPFLVATDLPRVVTGISGDFSFVVTSIGVEGEGPPSPEVNVCVEPASPHRYFPPWAGVTPLNVIPFDYNHGLTTFQNGANLASLISALQPGDRLEIGAGTYTMSAAFRINLVGTESAPIWIVAKDGEVPVITRLDNSQNALELGVGGPTRYVCLRGLEITSGDIAVRLHDCENVWMDQCHVHDCAQNAIAANSHAAAYLYFTRNEVHSTGGAGEGFYIGGNFSNPVVHDSVIALNHVYDTGGVQGDGIEVKQGSWGNLIAENVVHDTNYPCILVYGTDGNPPNVVERNVCWNSNDNVMQVQGEAIVRNNVLVNGLNGFHSGDHQGTTRDLVFVHNTVINEGRAANLSSWGGRPGMVFSNNALYSRFNLSMAFGSGDQGVQMAGNVVFGPVSGVSGGGFVVGTGLGDFVGVSWDGSSLNVTPVGGGALDGAADAGFAAVDELDGGLRLAPYAAGAAEE